VILERPRILSTVLTTDTLTWPHGKCIAIFIDTGRLDVVYLSTWQKSDIVAHINDDRRTVTRRGRGLTPIHFHYGAVTALGKGSGWRYYWCLVVTPPVSYLYRVIVDHN
jgi:hypothetical protein